MKVESKQRDRRKREAERGEGAGQFFLSQRGGADYAHPITTLPLRFLDDAKPLT